MTPREQELQTIIDDAHKALNIIGIPDGPDMGLLDRVKHAADFIKAQPIVNDTNRAGVLMEACKVVCKDRAATHGDAEKSFDTIANYWTLFLRKSNIIHDLNELKPWHIAMMMTLFKVARLHNNRKHRDNYVDIAGYIACAAEVAMKPEEPKF